MISELELKELVERYLDAVREQEADEFLDSLDDDEREILLRTIATEIGA